MGEEVLRRLIEAIRSGDRSRLRTLCTDNDSVIRASFAGWRRVPGAVRVDPTRRRWYARTLLAVAQTYEQLGDATLLKTLVGPLEDNPVLRWQQANDAGRTAVGEGRWADAERLLSPMLREMQGLSDPDAETLRAATLATLGQALFHLGRGADAKEPLSRAFETCAGLGDHEGVVAHAGSLIEVHRWLGHPEEAADLAERAAELLGRDGPPERAAELRRRAATARRPEPLARIVVETPRGVFEQSDVEPPLSPSDVRFLFVRNRPEVGEATRLVDDGTRHGARGDHAGALALFDAAATIDPYDPRPPHLAGLALMLLGRYADAHERYDRTETLAPGWYQCRTDRWLAGELASGRVGRAVLDALVLADDPDRSPDEILLVTRAALAGHPIAPLYLLEAKSCSELGRTGEAERASRAGLACAEEADVRTRLLVRLATLAPHPERRHLLEQAATLEGNLVAAAMARVMMLSDAAPERGSS